MLPGEVDTSEYEEFFGIRHLCNIRVLARTQLDVHRRNFLKLLTALLSARVSGTNSGLH